MSTDGVRRVVRTFLIAFLGILVPGALDWLNELTQWARDEGQRPFPDAHSLAFIGIAAISAGFIDALNLVWNWVEEISGKGFLRPVAPRNPGQAGQAGLPTIAWVLVIVILIVVLIALL